MTGYVNLVIAVSSMCLWGAQEKSLQVPDSCGRGREQANQRPDVNAL